MHFLRVARVRSTSSDFHTGALSQGAERIPRGATSVDDLASVTRCVCVLVGAVPSLPENIVKGGAAPGHYYHSG
jgi:hypothetical protein